MYSTWFLATVLASVAAAEESSTRVNYFGGGMDFAHAVGLHYWTSTAASVSAINAVATTYEIACLSDAPKSDCDIDTPWTMIQGHETYSLTGVFTSVGSGVNTITGTQEYDCTASANAAPSCSFSIGATGTSAGTAYSTSTSTSTSSLPTESYTWYGMDVTAGTSLFSASQATQTPTAGAAIITAAPIGAAAAMAIAALI